jgi:pSer/pThr/pTyr-binding forkhead associated (FHA) protein
VNISVLKNNNVESSIDLSKEVEGLGDESTTFFVGRADYCHIYIPDKSISREHLEIIYRNKGWSFRCLSEFSPVLLNGVQTLEGKLKNGDIIQIGQYQMAINLQEKVLKVESVPVPEPSAIEKEEESIEVDADEEIEIEKTESEASDEKSEGDSVDSGLDDLDKKEENPSEAVPEVSLDADAFQPTDAPVGDVSFDNAATEESDNLPTEGGSDSTRVFSGFSKIELELFGEFAPYDKFVVTANDTFIGRDANKCQIVINDPEVSSVHAVVRKRNVTVILEDLQSGNGTLLNGVRINKEELSNNDEFIIGSTTFTLKVYSHFIEEEKGRLMPVEENQVVEVEEIVEVGPEFEGQVDIENQANDLANEKSLIKRIMKDPKKKRIAMIVGVLFLAWFMFGEEEPVKKPPTKAQKDAQKTLAEKEANKQDELAKKINLSPEQLAALEATYQLGYELFQQGKYSESIIELEKVKAIDPNYKNTRLILDQANEGFRKLEELEQKRKAEIERKERMDKVKDLVEKAKEAVKERQAAVAEALFGKILELDPENFDVPQLKIEIDAWKKEQERIAVEKAQKEADRKRKVGLLQPSKTFYLKKEWYTAIIKLEEFLKIQDMDEDLTKEGAQMLEDARKQLNEQIAPLLGKGRSLKEGQDLKGAYESFLKVLDFDPYNMEAVREMNEIRDNLTNRSRKVYREAIISESLSLFDDAKEKLNEVMQISPLDSEYYKKSQNKLKNYLD